MEVEHAVGEGDELVVSSFFCWIVEVDGADRRLADEYAGKVVAVALQVGAVTVDEKAKKGRIQKAEQVA